MSEQASHLMARPAVSRTHSAASQPHVNKPTDLLLQDGPVNEEAAELLEEFVGTHEHNEPGAGLTNVENRELHSEWVHSPWWKKPSPIWILCIIPFSAMAQGATLAPKIELYTMLACRAIKPDIFEEGVFELADGAGLSSSMMPAVLSVFSAISPTISKIETSSPSSCATDPTVQAAVAQLSATFTTTTGVLSLLTTAWWGALSDRRGRVFVMGISLFGLLITDFNYLNVYYFSKYLPGGYWFLLVGPVIEGALGGFTSAVAAMHGYLADTTTETTRSRIFSLNLGLMFIGLAAGPVLGSLLISYTGQTISVFLGAAIVHLLYASFIWIVLPESLSKVRMQEARRNHDARSRNIAVQSDSRLSSRVGAYIKSAFRFMSPLSVFLPNLRPNANPLKKPQRDWSLTLLAVGYGFTMSLMASYPYTFQYAAANFGWDSVKLGYFVSIVGGSRAVFLTVLLPLAIKLFKPEPLVIDMPAPPSEREPLLSRSHNSPSRYDSTSLSGASRPVPTVTTPTTTKKVLHSPTFELIVVRVSLLLEIVSYTCMGLSPTGGIFAMASILAALGVGFSPAVQTVALALYARKGGKETGRLFGALSVVSALGSQVLGPTIYGLVYMKTVAYLPQAIFIVSVTGLTISLLTVLFVRLPKDDELRREIILASQGEAE